MVLHYTKRVIGGLQFYIHVPFYFLLFLQELSLTSYQNSLSCYIFFSSSFELWTVFLWWLNDLQYYFVSTVFQLNPWQGKALCNGLLSLFGLNEEEGLKPGAARSRSALNVQCLRAKRCIPWQSKVFFFLKRKILINYTNIFKERNQELSWNPYLAFKSKMKKKIK